MPKYKVIRYEHLVEKAKQLRRAMTKAEACLWCKIKNRQLLNVDFDRQRPINKYIVDFYCKELYLAIEIDGKSHDFEESKAYDDYRQKELEELGVHFLRFTDNEVLKNIEGVFMAIENWVMENRDID